MICLVTDSMLIFVMSGSLTVGYDSDVAINDFIAPDLAGWDLGRDNGPAADLPGKDIIRDTKPVDTKPDVEVSRKDIALNEDVTADLWDTNIHDAGPVPVISAGTPPIPAYTWDWVT